ncbi:MAG: acylphosphatase [Planctomycetota bacterium]|jgi:acylphosphatase
MIRARIIFTGRVQGVGFRATTASIASRFDITGWVRNEPDASVMAIAQGEPEVIGDFLDAVRSAMPTHIEHIHTTHSNDIEPLEGFSIRL